MEGSGDMMFDSDVSTSAVATFTPGTSSDVAGTAVVIGTAPPVKIDPCGTSSGGSGGGTPPPPVPTACGTISPLDLNPVSVRRNGGSSVIVRFTAGAAMTITATPNSNLSVTPTSRSLAAGGTGSFTISSITRTRSSDPPFTVVFSNNCGGSYIQYVKVTN